MLGLALGWSTEASAIERLELALGDLVGPGWRLEQLQARLPLGAAEDAAAELSFRRWRLPDPLGEVREGRLTCRRWRLEAAEFACEAGRLSAHTSQWGPLRGRLSLRYSLTGARLNAELELEDFLGTSPRLRLDQTSAAWTLALTLPGASVGALREAAQPWLSGPLPFEVTGVVAGQLRLRGAASGVSALTFDLEGRQLGFSDAEGLHAAEGLRLPLQGALRPAGEGWALDLKLTAGAGQLYWDPLYWDFTEIVRETGSAATLEGDLLWEAGPRRVQIQSLVWHHPAALEAELTGGLALTRAQPAVQRLVLHLRQGQFPALFTVYAQPWLADTSFNLLDTAGRLSGELALEGNALQRLRLNLEDLSVSDPAGRFALEGLQGRLLWADDDQRRENRVQWDQGRLYQLPLGPAELRVTAQGRTLELAQPARIPVLDGALLMDSLRLDATKELQWSLDAALTPISMPRLTQALGWPEMGGTLSGIVPQVRYDAGELVVGGTLLVRAFDGEATIRNLRLERPLGLVPRLWADLAVKRLDLEALTGTFSFGKIEGGLSGAVEGLYMEAWRPVAFDAWFETPEEDDARHRISQKAVDNLSSIGGGVSGALSRTFLSFLEDFPYRDLGIRCRLHNGVCEMGGVAPAPQGYYIVRGRMLPPRIDVIGYRERVDWDSLINRLKAVTLEQGPRVE